MKWETKNLGELFDITSSKRVFQSEWRSDGVPFYRARELAILSETGKVDNDLFISREMYEEYTRQYGAIQPDDILITGVGTLGKVYVVKQGDKFYFKDGNIIWLRSQHKVDSNFVCQLYFMPFVIDQVVGTAAGSTVGTYTITNAKATTIPVPPLPEQRRIAEALSDTDALITSMEKLITKKRTIKQGAMQELLTGRRQLPGFEDEWVEKPLGEIGWLSKESVNPQLTPTTLFSEYSMPAYDDEYLPKNVFGHSMHSTRLRISNNVLLFNKLNVRQRRIWLVGSCRENAVCSAEFLPYYSEIVSLEFLLQLMMTDKVTNDFEGMSTGTSNSQKRILPRSFLEYKVLMPPTKEEQTKVACVLSDMDAEIDTLAAKLNKLRCVKQGMMSELLTGHIRLPELEAKVAPETVTVLKIIELPKSEPKIAIKQTGGHNQQFDDAVMIAGIVNVLYSDKFLLGRKKVQKCLYLLRRHQDESTSAFKKRAAGPYADEVRYKGGEPIAQSAKYIARMDITGKGTTFACGAENGRALSYIQNWGKQADIKWVADKLKYKKVDELELLTTVDMAICDLTEAGTPVSIASIKHLIATNEEWKAKLKKQSFSDINIAYAIRELQTLLQGGN